MDIQQFNYNVDVLKASLWQYDNAPNLQGLLNAKKSWYEINQTAFWNDWYTDVFNLKTANKFGLSVWSILLGQSLLTPFAAPSDEIVYGFGADNGGFGYNFAQQTGGNNTYSLEISRLLLRLRYYQLTSSGTVPETNRMLVELFADYGDVYLVDNLDMTQIYVFKFAIPAEMRYMLDNTDVLPRPAGVGSEIIEDVDIIYGFGDFNGGFGYNFGA